MDDKELSKMNDHDLLLTLCRDSCWIKKTLSNHLKHHFLITITALGAFFTLLTVLVVKVI